MEKKDGGIWKVSMHYVLVSFLFRLSQVVIRTIMFFTMEIEEKIYEKGSMNKLI